MRTSNLRKKTASGQRNQKYISNRKKKDYEREDEQSDPDEYENDLQDLKLRIHMINYNYYTEALKQMMYEQSRPLMPLKLGPLIQKPNLLGEPARNPNGQSSYAAQFNQGNMEQYNNLTSPTYQQIYYSQQNQKQLRGSNSTPNLLSQPYSPLMNQYVARVPSDQMNNSQLLTQNYPVNNYDTVKLPPIYQGGNYQKSRFSEQIPMIASPNLSQLGQSSPTMQQQNYDQNTIQTQQMSPMALAQNDTTYIQNQRLTNLGTPYDGNQQETVQYINGKKYTIKQMTANSPLVASYGADSYIQQNQLVQQKKKKKNASSRYIDETKNRIGNYDDFDNYEAPSVFRSTKSKKTLNMKSNRNIDNRRSQRIVEDEFDDDDGEEEENYRQQRKNKSKSKASIAQDDEDIYEDRTQNRRRGKSRGNTRVLENDYDQEDKAQNRRRGKSRGNSRVFEDQNDAESVRSNKRSKSRKNTTLSRRGGDNYDDQDDNFSVRKKKNKSRVMRNDEEEDYQGLDEFKPKKGTLKEINEDEYQDTRNSRQPKKKTVLRKRDEEDYQEENQQEDRPQRNRSQKKKTIVKNENEYDEQQEIQRPKGQKRTMIRNEEQGNSQQEQYQQQQQKSRKNLSEKTSKNNINSLKYLKDVDENEE